jgi:osmotically-inducible protein OsmY
LPECSAEHVQQRIEAALQRHADVEASHVEVSVTGSTVTLSGTVESLPEMDRIRHAAWSAPSVARVVDQVRAD